MAINFYKLIKQLESLDIKLSTNNNIRLTISKSKINSDEKPEIIVRDSINGISIMDLISSFVSRDGQYSKLNNRVNTYILIKDLIVTDGDEYFSMRSTSFSTRSNTIIYTLNIDIFKDGNIMKREHLDKLEICYYNKNTKNSDKMFDIFMNWFDLGYKFKSTFYNYLLLFKSEKDKDYFELNKELYKDLFENGINEKNIKDYNLEIVNYLN